MGTISTLGLTNVICLETGLSEVEAQFLSGTLFAQQPQPEPELSFYLPPSAPSPSAFIGGGFAMMGNGKGAGAARLPSYPVFNLDDFDGRPLREMIDAARSFHHQASFLRPPGFSSFATRSQREEIEKIKGIHRRIAFLLALQEAHFPLETKGVLIRLFHGPDSSIQNHLSEFLREQEFPFSGAAVQEIQKEVAKLARYGFAEPIDLVDEEKKSKKNHEAEIEAFFRRFAAKEIAIAVVSSADLAGGTSVFQALSREEAKALLEEVMAKPAMREMEDKSAVGQCVDLSCYGEALAQETERINRVRAHVADLEEYTARLQKAVDQFVVPYTLAIDVKGIFKVLGAEGARALLRNFPHGTVTLDRKALKRERDYFSRMSGHRVKGRAGDYFPVVVAIPRKNLVNEAIDLSCAEAIDLYALEGGDRRLKNFLSTAPWRNLAVFHPFIPFPKVSYPGGPRNFLMAAMVLQTGFSAGAVERLISEEGAREDLDEAGFPKEAVRWSRKYHRSPQHYIRQGIESLEEQLAVIKRENPTRDDWFVQRDRLAIRFLREETVPLELKAALRNAYDMTAGEQVQLFLDAILKRYRDEGFKNPSDFTREFFAGYFTHMPWGWRVMVEEGLGREEILGIKNRDSLGVKEVPPELREPAWRFAYATTHLMGFSQEQAALILKRAAFSPNGENPEKRRDRFSLLGRLALPTDAGVFEFLRNYRMADDMSAFNLRYFLERVNAKSDSAEVRWRFQTAMFREAGGVVSAMKKREESLLNILYDLSGGDPVHLWDMEDAVALLSYHLSDNLAPKQAASALQNVVLAVRGYLKMLEYGDGGEDIFMIESKQMMEAAHLSDLLRGLGKAFSSRLLAAPLRDFLAREANNLHALQSLLVAFHLREKLSMSEERFAELFKEEKRLAGAENSYGKIRNSQFLKSALMHLFGPHLHPNTFALEMERRVAQEFASQDEVTRVEVIPETWLGSVTDFRIHRQGKRPFLVEVKTSTYNGKDFDGFCAKVCEQIGQAGWQLSHQRRCTRDGGKEDQIRLYIRSSNGKVLDPDEMARLRRESMQVIQSRGFNFIGTLHIEQVNG